MGHYLRTVNPAAAARADMPVPSVLPRVGDIVTFVPRRGEAPPGEYAMFVTSVDHMRERINGVVIFEGRDIRDFVGVPQNGDQVGYGWEWRDPPGNAPAVPGGDLADLQMLVRNLTETQAAQAEVILALRDQIRDLETRLDVVEDGPASAPAPVKAPKRKKSTPE